MLEKRETRIRVLLIRAIFQRARRTPGSALVRRNCSDQWRAFSTMTGPRVVHRIPHEQQVTRGGDASQRGW